MEHKTTYIEEAIRADYRVLTKYLIRKGYMITTMESATSGQIASLITDTEGSSAVMKGAFITYSNEAKIRSGVPEETIRTYTVYSRETAQAMAKACRLAYGAEIGIGVTGTMGNIDPENPENSMPGCIYFAFDFGGKLEGKDGAVFLTKIPPQDTRLQYKLAAAKEVFDALMPLVFEEDI